MNIVARDLEAAGGASLRPSPSAPHVGLVLLALAMGGFAIGTTEFAAMSLLPYFAADFRID